MESTEMFAAIGERVKDLAEQTAQGLQQATQYVRETVVPEICRISVNILNRSNLGKTILRFIRERKLRQQEEQIKIRIQEMVNEGGCTVVSVDVLDGLDEMDETPICTVEIECQQVEDDLMPGEVILLNV